MRAQSPDDAIFHPQLRGGRHPRGRGSPRQRQRQAGVGREDPHHLQGRARQRVRPEDQAVTLGLRPPRHGGGGRTVRSAAPFGRLSVKNSDFSLKTHASLRKAG